MSGFAKRNVHALVVMVIFMPFSVAYFWHRPACVVLVLAAEMAAIVLHDIYCQKLLQGRR